MASTGQGNGSRLRCGCGAILKRAVPLLTIQEIRQAGERAFATISTMIDTILVPAKTVVNAKGDGVAVDISAATHRVFLLTLAITKIIEQESLDVSLYGSADGATWEPKAIVAFPQKFYRGQQPLLVDLTQHPSVRFLRAHWEVNRWGRGAETPMFEFDVTIKEIPPDLLRETVAEAKALA